MIKVETGFWGGWGRVIAPVGALVVCLGLATVVLMVLGFGAGEVWGVVWEKVIWPDQGRRLEKWADVLVSATPLLLTGLAIAAAFRASVWNIGGQGQYVVGAIAAVAIGVHLHAPGVVMKVAILACAAGCGAVLAGLAGMMEWWRRVPVVLSTLLLNFVAFGVLSYLLAGPMADGNEPGKSPAIAAAGQLGTFGTTRLHWGFVIAVAAAIGLWFVLNWTTFGFRLRVVGENPVAGRFAGMNVARVSVGTLALSGALAGLAGGVEVAGVSHLITADAAKSGYGFTGIAVALLARLSPLGVIAAAIFFGLMNSAFAALEAELRVPYVMGQAMQGGIVLMMLVVTHRRQA